VTAANFPNCLQIVLASEGGFVDDPADPGGATNLGITLRTLASWRGPDVTITDVQALTPEDVAPIYRADYFNAAHCDALPDGVDLMTFDCAVNQGVGKAIRTLQSAAATTPDGSFGPNTARAVAALSPVLIIEHMATLREAFYRSLPTFGRFGNGWLARLSRTAALAQGMTGK